VVENANAGTRVEIVQSVPVQQKIHAKGEAVTDHPAQPAEVPVNSSEENSENRDCFFLIISDFFL
jgi:hypothetical protein